MSRIKLDFAELHTALFLAGTNLQLKLQPEKRRDQGMRLEYDRKEKELLVFFNKKVAIVPSSNVASMAPTNPADLDLTDSDLASPQSKTEAPKPVGKIKAQASTPTSHVEDGLGHGKS